MASNNLPAGAFLTTIDGRRCTAVPRVAAASSSSTSIAQQVTTTLNAIVQTTENPPIATPTTAAVAVAAGDQEEAAPRIIGDEQNTSTTSSSPENIIINTEPVIAPPVPVATSVVQVVQAQEESPVPVVASTPLPPPPEPAAPVPGDGGFQSFSVIAGGAAPTQEAPPLQTFQSMIQIQISETNGGNVIASPTGAAGPANSGSPSSGQQIPGILPVGAGGAPLSTTIESPSQPSSSNNGMSSGPVGDSTNSQVSTVPGPNNNTVRSTLAVAGGVIGGVVAISIIAFLIWWFRRQRLRRRRSTLLTPLNMANPFNEKGGGGGGGGPGAMIINEKGGYVIDRGSIGPTPVATKVRTALGVNISKIKGHLRNKTGGSTAPSVNMNRGTSQFMDASNASVHSRSNSAFERDRAEPTAKDRFVDWWSRLTADINFNWRTRSSQIDTLTPMGQPPVYTTNPNSRAPPASQQQPDFLTLLSMDDNQLDQEAQRLRSRPRSQRRSASAHFLSGLGLSFNGGNPFSDPEQRTSATPAPLAVPQAAATANPNPFADPINPFADPIPAGLINKPSNYVSDAIRRSRGQSIATTTYLPPATPGFLVGDNMARDSLASVATFSNNNRNKFRSDPFDLELPSAGAAFPAAAAVNKLSMISSNAGTAGNSSIGGRDSQVSALTSSSLSGSIRKPEGARVRTGRAESFSSKYSSGISLGGDWSDPGPDVGPLGLNGNGSEVGGNAGVGKAM
ncbi:hypothetical protein QBC44DRAFT_326916 [Cladorrhinum sp. PSN332]|nr:hypothetical protein QBC44DRAFT_326916 [Cladorrhinum sp. PSN332]